MAKYIDAEQLKKELVAKVFSNYTDEFWGVMQVVDEMRGIIYPPEYKCPFNGWDEYCDGYNEGWTACMSAIEKDSGILNE